MMNITNLFVQKYKNIQAGLLVFPKCGYTALVGENGSGKSNWVEAVAAVIQHLLGFKAPTFKYILRLAGNKKIEFDGRNIASSDNGNPVDLNTLELPEKLIACYSGEDLRMWDNILNDSYAHYFASSSMNTITEPKVIYINKFQWGIALLVLLCSDDVEVKNFIKEIWGSDIPLNQIKVEATIDNSALTRYQDHNAQLLARTLQANPLYVNAIKILNFGLVGTSNLIRCRRLYYLLYALSMPVANGGAIRMQKAITSINIETDSGLKLADLSEGHKKRILVMLMTRILGDEHTMYLLDEPDAHVDVMAKNKIVSLIETAKGYTILTTHSPLMTSVMKPEAVQTVNEGNVVEEEWASVVNHLSANRITTIDNFLFSFNKKVIITEGPYDIKYIRQAVKILKDKYPQYEKIEKVAAFCINGTGGMDFFLKNSMKSVVKFFEKVVFLLDNDEAGRKAEQVITGFVNANHVTTIEHVLYADQYKRPMKHDFLIEDYFPAKCYKGKTEEIKDIDVKGYPKYYQIKVIKSFETPIKQYLEDHYTDKEFNSKVYANFVPLLDQIILKLGL